MAVAKPPRSGDQIVAMSKPRALACIAFILASSLPAAASSSAWYETQGGQVRLVTTGKADASGHLQGALQIMLLPGWKTYWRDPGDSGVPPQLDISPSTNVTAAALSFPPPRRHDDGYGKWAGYTAPVTFPVTFTLAGPDSKARIEADIFLGVCQEICLPVQTRLSLDPASDPENASDAAVIRDALNALPAKERPDFRATETGGDHETMNVEAVTPAGAAPADLFVAGENGYMLGTPVLGHRDGKAVFTIPILDRPDAPPTDGGLHYTLTTAAGAVEGLLPYPR